MLLLRALHAGGANAQSVTVMIFSTLTLNRSPGVRLDLTQVWWQFISVHQVAAPRHLR